MTTDVVSGEYNLTFLVPHDGTETYLTVQDIHISGVGQNFVGVGSYEVNVTIANELSQRSTQDERLECRLRNITNLGN
jgi:hypothetical protein